MLLKEFPDIQWLKNQIKNNFENKKGWGNRRLSTDGWPTVVLNTKAKDAERTDILGPFSIFTNISGSSKIGVENRRVTVNDACFVVSNNEQYYDLLINNSGKTETFNIHLGNDFCQQAWTSLRKDDGTLLDDPGSNSDMDHFYFRSLPRDETFNALVKKIQYGYSDDQAENEELLLELFNYVCSLNSKEVKLESNLDAVKLSTRNELLQRLYLGRDYMHGNFHCDINLDDIATQANLSKFHFLRLFKQVFKVSPHQYIKKLRIQKAKELIRQTDKRVSTIALEVGLENGSSLSRLLYKSTGKYPQTMRLIN
ncbi:MAG: helix-turn-helix transcriptional regulator [Cyclobacteriaceae bacterium]